MAAYTPYRGACLSIPYNNIPHLFVVLNDPDQDGMYLAVMVTSVKKRRTQDETCILNKGDHPYIIKPSYMLYRMAETFQVRHTAKMVATGYYEVKEDMEEAVLEKIIEGLFDSDETRNRIIKYGQEVGL